MRIRAVWGLDIGSSALKLVRVEDNGGRLSVQTYGPVALPVESTLSQVEAVTQGLDVLLTSAGAKRASIAASLPRSIATIKFPRLPRVPSQQMAQMVRFEAQRYVPFALEDVVLSFQELPGHGHAEVTAQGTVDQMELLLVAVRRDIVTRYRESIASAGNPPSHLYISTLGLWNALHHSPIPADSDEAIAILDIGGKSSTIVGFHADEMIFNRSAGIGSDGLTTSLMREGSDRATAESLKRDRGLETLLQPSEGGLQIAAPEEEWGHSLVSEMRRSLAALRGEHRSLRVERLFLTGGGAKTPGLAEYLEGALGLSVQALELPGLVSDPQFLEATGVALGSLGRGATIIDLVSEEIERERVNRRHKTQMRLGALVGAAILAGAVALGVTSMQKQSERAQRIASVQVLVDRADRQLKNVRTEQEKIRTQAEMLKMALQPNHTWLDILQDINDRTPNTVWLTGMDLEKGKPLAVRGTALNSTSVQTLWGNLSRSPYFQRPTLSYSNSAKLEERQVFQFGITADIVGNRPKPSRPQRKRTSTARTKAGGNADTKTGTESPATGG